MNGRTLGELHARQGPHPALSLAERDPVGAGDRARQQVDDLLRVVPPTPFGTTLSVGGERARLGFAGEFDLAGVKAGRSALEDALASGLPVEVDLRGLTFLDSAGLGLLVRASQAHDVAELRFLGPVGDSVERLLRLTGADDLLRLDATRAGAAPAGCGGASDR